MIVVVSNRKVNHRADDHEVFGDEPNTKGHQELRVAVAELKESDQRWCVDLRSENDRSLKAGKPPSRQLFEEILSRIRDGSLASHWVIFVHGFNQSFRDNLDQCREIERIYGVNVLAFSWPSNQGGFITNEYQKARAAAQGATPAFDRIMEKLQLYLADRPFDADCSLRLNLMAYSMGNYVLENFVRAPVFSGETGLFDNVVLTQADVDLEGHAEWVEKITNVRRVYVTINEDDSVLRWSECANPPRLGNTARGLAADNAVYFDFTGGRDIGSAHGIFYETAERNKVVRQIFQRALTGKRAEVVKGIERNPNTGAFELVDK